MEIVGQLTGGAVHDWNNIRIVIIGTIEILAEAVEEQPDLAAIAGLIAEAAARGTNLGHHRLGGKNRPAVRVRPDQRILKARE